MHRHLWQNSSCVFVDVDVSSCSPLLVSRVEYLWHITSDDSQLMSLGEAIAHGSTECAFWAHDVWWPIATALLANWKGTFSLQYRYRLRHTDVLEKKKAHSQRNTSSVTRWHALLEQRIVWPISAGKLRRISFSWKPYVDCTLEMQYWQTIIRPRSSFSHLGLSIFLLLSLTHVR